MIPKIIHYCWFGNCEISEKIKDYISSWKEYLSDYEFKCWNEKNYDVNKYIFIKEAYELKKYAFVSDMVRLDVLYTYGGIYLDVDMQVLSNLDSFLECELLLGFDSRNSISLASCFIGCIPKQVFIKHLFDIYTRTKFVLENGKLNETPNTVLLTKEVQKFYNTKLVNNKKIINIANGIIIYPMEYFHALDLCDGNLYKTFNTSAIHWHTLLWVSRKTKFIKFIRQKVLIPILGEEKYLRITKRIKEF